MTNSSRATDLAPSGRKARTRLAILQAAGELFAEQGVTATPVEQIAERAGVSVGALYAHYGSKHGLVLAFISDAFKIVEDLMEEARSDPSPLRRVYAAGDAFFAFAAERPAAVRFAMLRVLQPDPSTEFADANQAMSKRAERIVMNIAIDLRAAMVAGETPVAPIDETMVFLWGLWNGVASLMVRQDGAAIPADLAGRALDLARTTMELTAKQYLGAVPEAEANGRARQPDPAPAKPPSREPG